LISVRDAPRLRGGELYKYQERKEEGRMNKKLSALLICTATILSMLLIPTVFANKSTPVSGTAPYKLIEREDVQIRGNTVHVLLKEVSHWMGDIAGDAEDYPCRLVIHGSEVFPPTSGFDFRWYTSIVTFDEGACTVTTESGPVTGGLVMRLVGKDSGLGTPWLGSWIILKGTGDLKGINGHGTWSATGGVISYSGWIHLLR